MLKSACATLVTVLTLGLAACSTTDPGQPASTASGGGPGTRTTTATTRPSTTSPTSNACAPGAVASRLSLEQQVGQVFMVGNQAGTVSPDMEAWAARYHVGNVMLTKPNTVPATVLAKDNARIQQLTTTDGVGGFIATDQEGGNVQVLRGAGFDRMPSALLQGGWEPATIQSKAAQWAGQLKAAGLNLNLAPVADVPAAGASNPPIGDIQREFGHTPQIAGAGASAFVKGQLSAGIAVSVKHFPGLGAVTANTDFSAHVVDTTTAKDSASIDSFRQVIDAGAPLVMVSSATYQKIDPDHLAVFSPIVLNWLRAGLGFGGAVISDDLSAARAPQVLAPGPRAIAALSAGVDLVLLSGDPTQLPAMWSAVRDKASADPAFRTRIGQAATRVLAAKQRIGLISCSR